MEKNVTITISVDNLSTALTAIHMELMRDEYDDNVKGMLADAFVALMEFAPC